MSAPVKVGETVTVVTGRGQEREPHLCIAVVSLRDRGGWFTARAQHASYDRRDDEEGSLWIRGTHNQETPEGAALLTVRALNP